METCIKCCGTGVMANGNPCDCGARDNFKLPIILSIPSQYQGVKFDRTFLPNYLQDGYGSWMESLIHNLTTKTGYHKNLLICAPPNSGKTIFAYTVYSILSSQGERIPKLIDLMEARDLLLSYYNVDIEEQSLLCTTKVAIIKVPMDLPNKFAETMSTIIERRVRNNGTTVFLYNGTKEDIIAQDRFGKFELLVGDGSYNSVQVTSWKPRSIKEGS